MKNIKAMLARPMGMAMVTGVLFVAGQTAHGQDQGEDDQCLPAAAQATLECSVAAIEGVACSEGDISSCLNLPVEGAGCINSAEEAYSACSSDSSSPSDGSSGSHESDGGNDSGGADDGGDSE